MSVEEIERDIVSGFEEIGLKVADFQPLTVGEGRGPSGGTATIVEWRCRTVVARSFQGIRAPGKEVEVVGVTIFDPDAERDTDDPEAGPFKRYIDWVDVMSQLGVAFEGRPVPDD